jgi:hypothetical protein
LRRGTGKAAIQETTIDNAHQNSVVELGSAGPNYPVALGYVKKRHTSDFKKCNVL